MSLLDSPQPSLISTDTKPKPNTNRFEFTTLLNSKKQSMATHSLQSLHHRSFLRLHHSDTSPATATATGLKLTNPTTNLSLSSPNNHPTTPTGTIVTFSVSSSSTSSQTSSTPTASEPISFDLLQQYLSAQNFRQADEETRRLLIVLAGEAAQKRGYVFFSEVQFISEADMRAIDELWRQHSDNKFGYSVQKRVWQKFSKDFTKFFLKVGWMKKLETEVEQYNYRAFPNEFMWENGKETPEGHLPLTNALRGTQLLNSILTHPAFQGMDEGEEEEEEEQVTEDAKAGEGNGVLKTKPLSKGVFKPDYRF